MTDEDRKNKDTMDKFRFAKWLVVANTLFWIAYIAGSMLGYEERFPLGRSIIRLEKREKVVFLKPAVADRLKASTRAYAPLKKNRFAIGREPQTFAFAMNLDGPWALGVLPGTAMKMYPRVELLDEGGNVLADNSRSPVSWKPFPGTSRYRSSMDGKQPPNPNHHGSGLTADLAAGKTYLLRISPEAGQDFEHAYYSVQDKTTVRVPNTYDLIIRPYRSNHNHGVTPVAMLFGVPLVYLFFLFRFSMKLMRKTGPSPERTAVNRYFSEMRKKP